MSDARAATPTGSRGSTSRRSDSDLRLVEPRLQTDRTRETAILLALLFAAELMFVGALVGCKMILGGAGEPPVGRPLAVALPLALLICSLVTWIDPARARLAAMLVSAGLAANGGWLAWSSTVTRADLWLLAGIGLLIHNLLALAALARANPSDARPLLIGCVSSFAVNLLLSIGWAEVLD